MLTIIIGNSWRRHIWFCWVFLMGLPWPAAAFKPAGHEQIERRAYEALRTDTVGYYAGWTGPEALRQLVTAGFLQNAGTGEPKVLSGYPDLSLERQFYQDQQAYHFMASNQAVLQALKTQPQASTAEWQQRLLVEAYGECARLMYFLYREILYNPTGARQAGRGTYVLMHILVDSYSREHTERNVQYELTAIKGWQLNRVSWPAPSGAGSDWQRDYLHGVSGPRDYNWHQEGNPSALSVDGEQARRAVLDLLVLLLEAHRRTDRADSLWLGFVQQHLQPAGLTLAPQTSTYRGGSPNSANLPVLYRVDPRGTGRDPEVWTIYDFDRSPGKYYGLLLPQGIRGTQAGSIFYMAHISPRNTSGRTKLQAFWKRLPKSIEGSWTGVWHRDREGSWNRGGQLQLVAGTGVAVPVLDQAVLIPRAGLGYTPRGRNPVQGIGGLELARSFGNAALTPRAALGIEYDSGGIPAHWSVYIRFGFNYWHGRMVKAHP